MKVCIVDINRKIVLVMELQNRSAINLARKIYFTPPQRRRLRIVHYECETYQYLDNIEMSHWVCGVTLSNQELYEWQNYPVIIVKRRK